jgi:hypothetical protein
MSRPANQHAAVGRERTRRVIARVGFALVFIIAAACLLWPVLIMAGCQARTVVTGAQSQAQRTTDEVRPIRRKTTTTYGPPLTACHEAKIVPAPKQGGGQ